MNSKKIDVASKSKGRLLLVEAKAAKGTDPFAAPEIGKRLRQTRLALGYTQPFIAQLCGMKPQAWNNNECGRDRMGIEAALRLCAVAGIDLDWIYRGLTGGVPADLLQKINEVSPEALQVRAYRLHPSSPAKKPVAKSRRKAKTSARSSLSAGS